MQVIENIPQILPTNLDAPDTQGVNTQQPAELLRGELEKYIENSALIDFVLNVRKNVETAILGEENTSAEFVDRYDKLLYSGVLGFDIYIIALGVERELVTLILANKDGIVEIHNSTKINNERTGRDASTPVHINYYVRDEKQKVKLVTTASIVSKSGTTETLITTTGMHPAVECHLYSARPGTGDDCMMEIENFLGGLGRSRAITYI